MVDFRDHGAMKLLAHAALLALLSTWLALPSCATTSSPIAVTKDCLIQAGHDTAGPAITEIESAVAMPTVASALAALERIAGHYGIAFVSCVVDRVTGESQVAFARSNEQDGIALRKITNGHEWLELHPVGQ